MMGVSRGGGLISIKEVDGFPTDISAQHKIVLIKAQDKIGSLTFITNVVAQEDCNIGTMTVNRHGKKGLAQIVMEIDSPLRDLTVDCLKSLNWVCIFTPILIFSAYLCGPKISRREKIGFSALIFDQNKQQACRHSISQSQTPITLRMY
ncbi:MAG: hypothetical protein R3B47_19030 [Bacteroidia bacterium]